MDILDFGVNGLGLGVQGGMEPVAWTGTRPKRLTRNATAAYPATAGIVC
jgi:hypothetical protein